MGPLISATCALPSALAAKSWLAIGAGFDGRNLEFRPSGCLRLRLR
jgi:hypothetical protein